MPYYLCNDGASIIENKYVIDIGGFEDSPCSDVLSSCCQSKRSAPHLPEVTINNECGIGNPTGVSLTITGDRDNEAQFGNIFKP